MDPVSVEEPAGISRKPNSESKALSGLYFASTTYRDQAPMMYTLLTLCMKEDGISTGWAVPDCYILNFQQLWYRKVASGTTVEPVHWQRTNFNFSPARNWPRGTLIKRSFKKKTDQVGYSPIMRYI